jgi:acyl-CoA synthetase (AMP-forming)/AMP-acid ligase II/acyl carrier protein
VPAVLMNLIDYLELTKQSLSFMKLLIVGSDRWYIRDYQRVKKLCGLKTKLINAYGVSEATIDSIYFEDVGELPFGFGTLRRAVSPLGLMSGKPLDAYLSGKPPRPQCLTTAGVSPLALTKRDCLVPIGRPFPNTQVYLLDNNLQPVPIGVWGEIHLGGSSLSRGYLNNSKLTKEKFISNPFTVNSSQLSVISHSSPNHQSLFPISHSLLYKTGDKARYLPDGNIEFLERIDNQVKIRGFRIELSEIEAAINQYKDVKQVLVIVQEDLAGNKSLVANVVLKQLEDNIERIIKKIQNHLKNYLPDYMIPANWQVLKALPLTTNGKLDRKLIANTRYLDSNYLINQKQLFNAIILSSNKQEKIIFEIWQDILQRDNIGVNDNFFDVGGHSLLLAQLQERLEKSLQISIAITDLFKYSTISSLANYLIQKENNSLTSSKNSKKIFNRISKQKAALVRQKQLRKLRKS